MLNRKEDESFFLFSPLTREICKHLSFFLFKEDEYNIHWHTKQLGKVVI